MKTTKRAIIMGATSGIGLEVMKVLTAKGWQVGIAGRRQHLLIELQQNNPNVVATECIDTTKDDAAERLMTLIDKTGGCDLYFHSSGIGYQNPELDIEKELATVETNALGFTRMVTAAFHYFEQRPNQNGQIAVISSIARTKGLGAAPAYSSTKRYNSHYLECLSQLARMKKLRHITITDIRPGFVHTDLLKEGNYPLQLDPSKVALDIVRGIERKKSIVTIDWRYRLLVFFWQLIPRWFWVRLKVTTKNIE
ncbi:MAG: SDR family NAD(P)-dependent oxidoreductase [Bacteroidales bacterium]|nr:SDR family NAD(P)-dependent oxidoreductase [Bacteroidales bacterium]